MDLRELGNLGDHGSDFTLDTVILYIKDVFSSNGLLFFPTDIQTLRQLVEYFNVSNLTHTGVPIWGNHALLPLTPRDDNLNHQLGN